MSMDSMGAYLPVLPVVMDPQFVRKLPPVTDSFNLPDEFISPQAPTAPRAYPVTLK